MTTPFIHFPEHALLILEERLTEREAEGMPLPEGMDRTELALRILILAELASRGALTPSLQSRDDT